MYKFIKKTWFRGIPFIFLNSAFCSSLLLKESSILLPLFWLRKSILPTVQNFSQAIFFGWPGWSRDASAPLPATHQIPCEDFPFSEKTSLYPPPEILNKAIYNVWLTIFKRDVHPKQTPSLFQIESFHQHPSNPWEY